MPAGTESSIKTHQYVAEGAGFEVTAVLDEPSSANAVYKIDNGVIVDVGGGTTGLAVIHDGRVVQVEDEPTGGTHLSLVLAGNYHIPFEEAEQIKQDYSRHKEILPVLKPGRGKDRFDHSPLCKRKGCGYDLPVRRNLLFDRH